VQAVAFSPDGKAVVTMANGEPLVRFWDAATGQPLGEPIHYHGIGLLTFSPDGKLLLTGSQVWDVATRKPQGPAFEPRGGVFAAVFHPTDQLPLTGSDIFPSGWGGEGLVWKVGESRPIKQPLPHRGWVWSAVYSPNGRTICTGSMDGTARLWDAITHRPIGGPLRQGGPVQVVAFSPDGKTVLTAGAGGVRLWDAASARPTARSSLSHESHVKAVAVSRDNRFALTVAGKDPTAQLWDLRTGRRLGAPWDHKYVEQVAFSPDGNTALTRNHPSYSGGFSVRLWDTATGTLRQALPPDRAHVYTVALSDDTLLTAGAHGASLWAAATGRHLRDIPRQQYHILAAAFSPDGSRLALGANGQKGGKPGPAFLRGQVTVWETATGNRLAASAELGGVRGVAFSPDGKYLLTGAEDGNAQILDARTLKPLHPTLRHTDGVGFVDFSRDGTVAVTAGWGGGARLWQVPTGKPVGRPLTHDRPIRCVAVGPDSRYVLTGSEDGMARYWETGRGTPLGPPLWQYAKVNAVALSDRAALTAGYGAAWVWPLPTAVPDEPERVMAWVQALTGLELDAGNALQPLDAPTWEERLRHLQWPGGGQP
jgi:WD40 repeat protein